MSLREPSQNQKMEKNLIFNFKPPLLENLLFDLITIFKIWHHHQIRMTLENKSTSKNVEFFQNSIFGEFFKFKPLCPGKEVNDCFQKIIKNLLCIQLLIGTLKYVKKQIFLFLKN